MWWSLLEMVSQVSRRWLWRGLWRVVACNVTQGFGENGGNGVADFKQVALEVAVEGVACNVTQGFEEISGNEIAERVRNDRL